MTLNAISELKIGQGFLLGPAPGESEVEWLRGFVERKWRGVLLARYPQLADAINATPIHHYHKIAHLIDHASTWSKNSRLFTPDEVDALTGRLSVFKFLKDRFGAYEVADIEHLGYPEIYWRLVRPKHSEDVAGAHADSWFYTLTNEMPADEQKRVVKVWLPVYAEPGVSGLSVAAESQKMSLAYAGEMRHGRMKPLMTDPREHDIAMTNLELSPGQCVAFHVDLLHKGIGHNTDQTRVSMEFAIRLEPHGGFAN